MPNKEAKRNLTAPNYLIVFADLIGSTEVAAEVPAPFYANTYIASFHWAVSRAYQFIKTENAFPTVKFRRSIEGFRLIGDEVLSLTPLPDSRDGKADDMVASGVAFAYVLKLLWLASPYNLQRLIHRQFPRDIAIGIHIGPAALVHVDSARTGVPDTDDFASLHINVAKRIENRARVRCESRILVSHDIKAHFYRWANRYPKAKEDVTKAAPLLFAKFHEEPEFVEAKGIPKRLQVLEFMWSYDCEHLKDLMEQLADTDIQNEDVDTEHAGRVLAKMFLRERGYPFWNSKKKKRAVEYGFAQTNTARDYIHQWFEVLDDPPKLFWDEAWLVLNAFLMSVAMIRHPSVPHSAWNEYRGIGNQILDRYKELIKKT